MTRRLVQALWSGLLCVSGLALVLGVLLIAPIAIETRWGGWWLFAYTAALAVAGCGWMCDANSRDAEEGGW